jgi:hypothetical protein
VDPLVIPKVVLIYRPVEQVVVFKQVLVSPVEQVNRRNRVMAARGADAPIVVLPEEVEPPEAIPVLWLLLQVVVEVPAVAVTGMEDFTEAVAVADIAQRHPLIMVGMAEMDMFE